MARRPLVILTPLAAWLLLGVVALSAHASDPEQSTFCRTMDSLVWRETRSWNVGHPNDPAADGTDGFAVVLARRIDGADLRVDAPPSMRPHLAAVARDLGAVSDSTADPEAASALTDSMARLLSAYREACS